MKKTAFVFFALLFTLISSAQCLIDPWTLEKRIDKSSLVVEGEIISKTCFWDVNHYNIYTVNEVKIHKVFKGAITQSTIKVVTLGGTVGLKNHTANPSLQFDLHDVGIIMLKPGVVGIQNFTNLYQPTASVQSFIHYDLTDFKAHDYLSTFISIKFDLYETIKGITQEAVVLKTNYNPEKNKKTITPLAPPTITAFSMDTVSSGTGTLLTITGTNFGFARGNGKVGFKDANFGDGRYYYVPYDWSYDSWSNSQIKVYVPTRAGTGTVEVVNNGNESGESSSDLYIKWAHLNVTYVPSGTDTQFYEVDHVNRNGNGGYLWQFTTDFASKAPATSSFIRAIEEWRCETEMNWDIGNDTTTDVTANDNVNIVRFTDFGSSTLGVCWSRRSGCFSGGTINWYVEELDIEFDSTYNWYYGTGSTPSGQYDFETVALHELGHGHQLGHVRDNSKVMHYSIGPATQKTDLVPEDIEAGNYVKTKSVASSPCGPGVMQAVPAATCQLSPAEANFSIDDNEVCPTDDVVFTDASIGTVTGYSWDFGTGASPAASTNIGPITVQYSSSGTKTVELIVSNLFGSDTITKTITVLPSSLAMPGSFLTMDTACLGFENYTIDPVDDADGYQWTLSSGGVFVGATNSTTVQVEWTSVGEHDINAVAANECAISQPRKETIYIKAAPVASFTDSDNSTTVVFTNTSSDAVSHEWTFGDGNTSTQSSPTHQFPDKGTYSVKYKATNQCGSDSVTKSIAVNFSASVEDISSNWEVYPNPIKSGEVLTIEGQHVSTYQFIDMQGRIVASGELNNNKIRIPTLEKGNYQLTLKEAEKQATYSIVILE